MFLLSLIPALKQQIVECNSVKHKNENSLTSQCKKQ